LSWLNLLGIAIGLAMDALAVSIAVGLVLETVTPRHTFRMAFHFGLFQAMMPVLGWLAGRELVLVIRAYDHWVAFGLLAVVGGKMLWEACTEPEPTGGADPTRGLMLVTLSLATSIDALAVGVSMGLMEVSIWVPAAVIGVVAAVLSALGIRFGARLGRAVGRWAEAGGGCVLLLIGLRILITHLRG